jgi:hypothetical protein
MSELDDLDARLTPGSATAPSRNSRAHEFDPDIPAWYRQPLETDAAWVAFQTWMDGETREVGQANYNWSSMWSWKYRRYMRDLYVSDEEAQAMVQYRVAMNERHRNTARVGLGKFIQWLTTMDPEKMGAATAVRLAEVMVKMERDASGAIAAVMQAAPTSSDRELLDESLAQIFEQDPEKEGQLARLLHDLL